jgi:hypothetical protein
MLKINERLFTDRFREILERRGILPDTQSGFRPGFRLQTRVLLFIEQISSYMANSSPVATIFVDFKSAFDQLWFEGCIGKLRRMGIPKSYLKWIESWLIGRRAYIELEGKRSRFFSINRGGPQQQRFCLVINLNRRVLLQHTNKKKVNFIVQLGVETVTKAQTHYFRFDSFLAIF